MAIYDNYDVDYSLNDDYIDDDDNEGFTDAGIETYMPTQGLPPLAMTGSIAATKQNCGLPFFYSFYVDHRGQIDPCSI